jgi:hypothetical protein
MFPRINNVNDVSSKQVEIIERALQLNGLEGLERNMVWGFEKSTGNMVQPKPKDVRRSNANGRGNFDFQGHRFTAPERSRLMPRVQAAFQKNVRVVAYARSHSLHDWRNIGKSVWKDEDKDYQQSEETIDQPVSKDEATESNDEIKFLYERPSIPLMIHRRNNAFPAQAGEITKNSKPTRPYSSLRDNGIFLVSANHPMVPSGLSPTSHNCQKHGSRPHTIQPMSKGLRRLMQQFVTLQRRAVPQP